jgi:hypothetical protein
MRLTSEADSGCLAPLSSRPTHKPSQPRPKNYKATVGSFGRGSGRGPKWVRFAPARGRVASSCATGRPSLFPGPRPLPTGIGFVLAAPRPGLGSFSAPDSAPWVRSAPTGSIGRVCPRSPACRWVRSESGPSAGTVAPDSPRPRSVRSGSGGAGGLGFVPRRRLEFVRRRVPRVRSRTRAPWVPSVARVRGRTRGTRTSAEVASSRAAPGLPTDSQTPAPPSSEPKWPVGSFRAGPRAASTTVGGGVESSRRSVPGIMGPFESIGGRCRAHAAPPTRSRYP